MNKIIVLFLLLSLGSGKLHSQTTPAEMLASKIAQKMKDTLNLTVGQREQLYGINMALHQQKVTVRQQFTNMDSVRVKIQRVENTRDSLYLQVLDAGQNQLYLQKKRNLVNNN